MIASADDITGQLEGGTERTACRSRNTPLGPSAPLALWLALLLGACASTPDREADGPPSAPPPNLERLPDAEPRIEPFRQGGPNRPYEVLGQRYVPMTEDLPFKESGIASWYGRKFHGRPTASGEIYDMHAMTAAHKTLPLPSYARVRNPANGREVIVRVNDRGPFVAGRVIDLSYAAAVRLGITRGLAPVEVRRITHAEIRNGQANAALPPAPASSSLTVSSALPTPSVPSISSTSLPPTASMLAVTPSD